jgi:hypothetical protein
MTITTMITIMIMTAAATIITTTMASTVITGHQRENTELPAAGREKQGSLLAIIRAHECSRECD